MEALAGMSDSALQSTGLPGLRNFVDRAKLYVEEKRKVADFDAMMAENLRLKAAAEAKPDPMAKARAAKAAKAAGAQV